jgi:hypothetical protein
VERRHWSIKPLELSECFTFGAFGPELAGRTSIFNVGTTCREPVTRSYHLAQLDIATMMAPAGSAVPSCISVV